MNKAEVISELIWLQKIVLPAVKETNPVVDAMTPLTAKALEAAIKSVEKGGDIYEP